MNSENLTQNPTTEQKDTPALVKKIGRTTYVVRVHFSKTGKETMSDKIKRMLKNEIQQNLFMLRQGLTSKTCTRI